MARRRSPRLKTRLLLAAAVLVLPFLGALAAYLVFVQDAAERLGATLDDAYEADRRLQEAGVVALRMQLTAWDALLLPPDRRPALAAQTERQARLFYKAIDAASARAGEVAEQVEALRFAFAVYAQFADAVRGLSGPEEFRARRDIVDRFMANKARLEAQLTNAGRATRGRFERSLAALRARIGLANSLALPFSLATLLLAFVTAVWLANRFSRPLGALLAGVERVARGDYGVQLLGAFPGEMGDVAAGFRRMATELAAAFAQLDDKNSELESILYAASHDLRTPLVNIAGFGARLGKDIRQLRDLAAGAAGVPADRMLPLLDDSMEPAVGYIGTSARRMDTLLGGLLRLSRTGRVELRAAPVDMEKLVTETLASLALRIEETGARVERGPLLPCHGDAALVGQALANLFENALKYRRPGTPPVLRLGSRREGAMAVYSVEDNGIGIPQEYRERVWELFHRLDPRHPEPGEGLGLTFVRRIVHRHGGQAWIEDAPDGGTRVCLVLPGIEQG